MEKTSTTHLLIQDWDDKIDNPSNRIQISDVWFSYSDKENHNEAIALFRHVFDLVDWGPYDILNYLNIEIIQKLKLAPAYKRLIFPDGLDKRTDIGYVAKLLYPDIIKEFDQKYIWIMKYRTILASNKKNVPINDFVDADRYDHARLLLNYFLMNNPQPEWTNRDSLYGYFADDNVWIFLKKSKLENVCKLLYNTPLDFLHDSLNEDEDDESSKDELTFMFTEFLKIDKQYKKKAKINE